MIKITAGQTNNLIVGNYSLEHAHSFVYLESRINETNDVTKRLTLEHMLPSIYTFYAK